MLRLSWLAGIATALLLSWGSIAHAQAVQYMVMYQPQPNAAWQTYGTFVSPANAEQLADTLSQQYPRVQIVPVNPPTPVATPVAPPAEINPRYWPQTRWRYDRDRYDRDRDRYRDRDRDRREREPRP
jgi:hypothetical protein